MKIFGKFPLYRAVTLTLLGAWALAMAFLVRREALTVIPVSGPQEVEASGEAGGRPAPVGGLREEWLGLYYQGKKIGYNTTTYSLEDGGRHVVQKTYLKLQLMGKGEEATVLTDARLAGDYTLRSFSFNLQSRSGGLKVTGVTVPGGIDLYVRSGESVIPQRIPISSPPRLNLGIEQYLLKKGLSPGKKYLLSFFDPTLRSNVELKVEVEGVEDVVIGGKTRHTVRLKETFQGMESQSWITEEGEVVKEKSPIGYTSLMETREEALTRGWPAGEGVDIIASSAIPSDTILDRPARLRSLTARVTLLTPTEEGTLEELKKGKIITNTRKAPEGLSSYSIPYKGGDRAEYLSPDPFIQSRDTKIAAKAGEIAGNDRDAISVVEKLVSWVYRNLDQTPTFGLPPARDILDNPTGDCKVHTILFSSLARSLGIPTKIMAGVIYRDGYFYYHAWPEVWLGAWVPVDPTFGEFPADVTHLPLTEGRLEDWIKVMGLVGNLKIEILKVS